MSFLSDRLLSSFSGRVCQDTLNMSPFPVCPVKTADVNTVWWCLTLTSIASVCQVVQLSDHYPVEVVLKSSALFLQATPLLSLISASVILWSFLSALWSSQALNAFYTRLSFFITKPVHLLAVPGSLGAVRSFNTGLFYSPSSTALRPKWSDWAARQLQEQNV